MNITVLGAGTWGTALSILLSANGHKVTLWSALQPELDALGADRNNVKNLPGAVLPDDIVLEGDLEKALANKPEIIVMAVASIFVRRTAEKIKDLIPDGQIIVNVAKGIEDVTLYTLTEVISDVLKTADVCVLSGPSHAEEVSKKLPTTIVVGADKKETACFVQDAFMADFFRVYTSPDKLGIELGGSLKNVIAMAAGVTDGLGYEDNTKAALMTRGIAEISRLGMKMGGALETFGGLSGMGDLIVTCTSLHSRNRNFGYYLGQGMDVESAKAKVGQTVEGVYCAKAAYALAKKYDVEMPIVEQINLVLFNGKSTKDAVHDLFTRDKTVEASNLKWNA